MYSDTLTREVNSFIFVPSIIAGSIGSYLLGMPSVVVVSWVAVFACTFLPPDNFVYPLAGGLFVITAVLLFLSSALILFDSIIIAILYFLGTREKYFGIADVKALIAGAISFPFAGGFGYPVFQLISNLEIPVPFLLILNSSVLDPPKIMWVCGSINPGNTVHPEASITWVISPVIFPASVSAIFPSSTRMEQFFCTRSSRLSSGVLALFPITGVTTSDP